MLLVLSILSIYPLSLSSVDPPNSPFLRAPPREDGQNGQNLFTSAALAPRKNKAYNIAMAPRKLPVETRILRALARPRTRKALCGHVQVYPVARLDAVLAPLLAAGQVVAETQPGRMGRPATVYRLGNATETETRP